MDEVWLTAKADPDLVGTLTDNIHVLPFFEVEQSEQNIRGEESFH